MNGIMVDTQVLGSEAGKIEDMGARLTDEAHHIAMLRRELRGSEAELFGPVMGKLQAGIMREGAVCDRLARKAIQAKEVYERTEWGNQNMVAGLKDFNRDEPVILPFTGSFTEVPRSIRAIIPPHRPHTHFHRNFIHDIWMAEWADYSRRNPHRWRGRRVFIPTIKTVPRFTLEPTPIDMNGIPRNIGLQLISPNPGGIGNLTNDTASDEI